MPQVYNKIYDPAKYAKVLPKNKDIIADFLKEMESQKKSAGTISQYSNDLRILAIWILDYCENRSFLDLKKRDYRNFLLHCDSEWGWSSARANRVLSALHMLLDFCENDEDEYEEYERSAAAKIKGLPREKVRDITFISDEVITKLYQKLMKEERYKEATLLAILYDSGCRKNEILQVERASISDDGNASNIVIGKRGKKFKVLYFARTKEAFKKYEANRADDSPLLFPTDASGLYNWVRKWEDDLQEITKETYQLNVHTFRHCFIQNMSDGTHYLCKELKLGALPLEKIKVLAHHSDISTTDGYRQNDEERDIENLFGIKM